MVIVSDLLWRLDLYDLFCCFGHQLTILCALQFELWMHFVEISKSHADNTRYFLIHPLLSFTCCDKCQQ